MKLTVAICTWNRASLLDQTLAQLQDLHVPGNASWELLVVNNNCTDETDEVLSCYADRLPLRRLFAEKQGLSHARNCAIDATQGELLLWTDDDVLVDRDWIKAYVQAAHRYPDAAFFGGVIEPWFEGTPPRWLQRAWRRVEMAYAARNFGNDGFQFQVGQTPFGANYAVRTAVQRRYRYDQALGRIGKEMLSGEESAVISAMLNDGLIGRWIPDARVRHFIPTERQSVRYLRRYFHGHGVVAERDHQENNEALAFGKPRWLWRAWLEAESKYRLRRLFCRPEVWIEDLIQASVFRGRLDWRKPVETCTSDGSPQ